MLCYRGEQRIRERNRPKTCWTLESTLIRQNFIVSAIRIIVVLLSTMSLPIRIQAEDFRAIPLKQSLNDVQPMTCSMIRLITRNMRRRTSRIGIFLAVTAGSNPPPAANSASSGKWTSPKLWRPRGLNQCHVAAGTDKAQLAEKVRSKDLISAHKKTIEQSQRTVRWCVFSTWSDRRGLLLVSQANCFRRLTRVRIRSASRAASNGFRKVSLNTERSKPDALSSSLSRPIRTVSVNSVFLRRF